jgi:hypothetical protein
MRDPGGDPRRELALTLQAFPVPSDGAAAPLAGLGS